MALSLLKMCKLEVFSEKGKALGRVTDVLFHPERNEVVGYVVTRPRLGMIVDLPERYLARDRASVEGDHLVVSGESGAWDAGAAKRLGIDWDVSVIWMGMPARTESGRSLGEVRDGLFDPETGVLTAVGLSGGAVADVAIGVRDLPARLVRGFDGQAVVFSDEAGATETSGGAAAAAGKGAAKAKVVAEGTADRATEVAVKAAAYGVTAVQMAAKSQTGKKAVGWLRKMKAAADRALDDDES